MHKPRPQEIYRHFKGRLYQVLTLCRHSETGEEMVVYQAMYGDFAIYCRPLYMFTEILDAIRYPDAQQTYRFQLMQPISESLRNRPDVPTVPDVLKKQSKNAREEERRADPVRPPSPLMMQTIEEEAQALGMDPRVVAFLDADTTEKRLQILDDLHRDITDDQIDICAMAVDAKIPAGDVFDRYAGLRDVLLTRQRFESSRLRS